MKEQQPLSPEDHKKLKKALIPMLFFPVIVIAMFGTFGYFFFSDFGGDGFAVYAFGIFGLIFFGIIGYFILSTYLDMKRGFKYIITGTVTDKQMRVSTSSSKGSSSSTKRYYSVFLDDVKYSIDGGDYERVKVGQLIELHKAPKSDLTLSLYILQDPQKPETSESNEISKIDTGDLDKFLKTDFPEVELSEQDKSTLKKIMWRHVKIKGLWLLPFAYIIFSLINSGYWGILIFLFPVVIIPSVMLYFLGRRINDYFRNLKYNYKKGTPTVVEDKSSITSNRAGERNQIRISQGFINVPKDLYEELIPGQQIIVFRPKYGKDPLSVMTLDQKEHHLR